MSRQKELEEDSDHIGVRFACAFFSLSFGLGAVWFASWIAFSFALALFMIAILPDTNVYANKTAMYCSLYFIVGFAAFKIQEVLSRWANLYLEYPDRYPLSTRMTDTGVELILILLFGAFGIVLYRWRKKAL